MAVAQTSGGWQAGHERGPAAPTPRDRARFVAAQAGLVVTMIFVYFGVRGLTHSSVSVAFDHAREVMSIENSLGINVERAWQEPIADSAALSTVANWVYVWGHWPVIAGAMIWLAWRGSPAFGRLRNGMVLSGLVGMAVFAIFPVAPPRLADAAMVDTVTERSEAYRVLQPPAFVNQYAAMPSLHLGWDLLVGIAIVTATGSFALRAIGCALPALMAVAVIVTANHYVLDAVAGVALVLVAHGVVVMWERRFATEASTRADPDAERLRVEVGVPHRE
jgi:PAP2 superfamily protein